MSASKHNLKIVVNHGASASGLRISDHVIPIKDDGQNPIQRFLGRTKSLIVAKGRLHSSQTLPLDCGLFLLGVVASTEGFIRDIVTEVSTSCNVSRRRLSGMQLSYGAADYYGAERMARGILQGQSLADATELKKLISQISSIKLKESDQVWTAIDEFSAVCHIRHSIVHSFGELGLNNLNAMGISIDGQPSKIEVDNGLFQSSTVVCTNLVRVINQFLFDRIISSWINDGRLRGEWKHDKISWQSIWGVFSTNEKHVPVNAYQAWRSIRGVLLARARSL